jgi:hypothetical protein
MRVLVTGSQLWPDRRAVYSELRILKAGCDARGESLTVVHGNCPTGADAFAAGWAHERVYEGVIEESHPADWKGPRKKGAGYARNAEMVKLGADLCLAFIHNESNGSTHCSDLAKKAGIETKIFRSASNMPQIQHPNRVQEELKLEGARLIFRNFGGEKKLYNEEGDRNFAVALDEETALEYKAVGWPIVVREKMDDLGRSENLYHLPVKVRMDGKFPPKLWVITKSKNSRTPLDADMLTILDYAEFDLVDLRIRPYNWGPIQGKFGTAAYLKIGFFILHEDDLELKYAHIPIEDEPLALESGIEDAEVLSDTEWEVDPQTEQEDLDQIERRELTRGSK